MTKSYQVPSAVCTFSCESEVDLLHLLSLVSDHALETAKNVKHRAKKREKAMSPSFN